MKKSFIYIFSAFCFSCGINSCSFLDENPVDRLVDNFYTSEKDRTGSGRCYLISN